MAFEPFDLGRVIQTAETIKAMRRQGADDELRRRYMETQIAGAQQTQGINAANESRSQVKFTQEQQIANTKLLNAAAAEVAQNPAAASRWLPQLQQAGIVPADFDLSSTTPEQLQAAAKDLYASTSQALAALRGPQEVGPLEAIIDPATGQPRLATRAQALGQRPYDKPPSTQIIMPAQRMESEANKAYGKAEGEAFSAVVQRGQDAQDKAQTLRAMRSNPAITGPTQDLRASANAFFSDLGVPIPPGALDQISNLTQYKGMANQLVMAEQLKQKGPQTESDAKRIREMFGQTKNIQEANRLLINYQLALSDRETLLAQMAEEYRQRTGKIDGWRQELRDYVRQTPLAGIDPDSKRLVFWNEFVDGMKEDNPSMTEEQIVDYWRKRYGGSGR